MKRKEEITELLLSKAKKNKIIRELVKRNLSFKLVGGAVVDIYLDRNPRDYDFEDINIDDDFIYDYESNTSTTYRFMGETLQMLKNQRSNFPYKIQQSMISYENVKEEDKDNFEENLNRLKIHFDYPSLSQKRLIPNNRTNIDNSGFLYCLPKWLAKGFTIHEIEYKTRLNAFLKNVQAKTGSINS